MCKTKVPHIFPQSSLNGPGGCTEQSPGGLLLCQRQTSGGQPETDTVECTAPRAEGKYILKTHIVTKTETINKTRKGAIRGMWCQRDVIAVRRSEGIYIWPQYITELNCRPDSCHNEILGNLFHFYWENTLKYNLWVSKKKHWVDKGRNIQIFLSLLPEFVSVCTCFSKLCCIKHSHFPAQQLPSQNAIQVLKHLFRFEVGLFRDRDSCKLSTSILYHKTSKEAFSFSSKKPKC